MTLSKTIRSSVVICTLVIGLALALIGTASADWGADGMTKAASRMNSLGLVKGRTGANGSVDIALGSNITRAELATMLVRAFGKETEAQSLNGSRAFTDSANHPWASGYIAMYKALVLEADPKAPVGLPDGSFKPNNQVSAAEAVAFITKMLGIKPAANLQWPMNVIQGAADAGILSAADAQAVTASPGSPVNRGLVFYLADKAFATYPLAVSGKTLYTTYVDTDPPVVTVNAYQAATDAESVTLTGTVSGASVLHVGYTAQDVITPNADGNWTATVALKLGENAIWVHAVDLAGNEGLPAAPVKITRGPGSVARIQVAPSSLKLKAGEVANLTISFFDKHGAAITNAKASVAVEGEIGAYSNGTVTASRSGTGYLVVSADAAPLVIVPVTVTPGDLAQIVLSPGGIGMKQRASQNFTVTGLDKYGNSVALGPVAWSASKGAVGSDGTYTAPGDFAGAVTITAMADGVSVTGTIQVSPLPVPTVVVLNRTAHYGDKIMLRATLMSGQVPLFGKALAFKVDGVAAGTAVTGTNGVATVATDYTVLLGAGQHVIQVDSDGDTTYAPSYGTGSLIVTQANATLAYTGQTVMPAGAASAISLSATVTQAAAGSVGFSPPAVSVQFVVKRVSDGVTVDTQTAAVNSSGAATATSIALPNVPYTVDVSLVSNNTYTAPALLPAATIKATPTLVVAAQSEQYSDPVTLTATLTDGAGGVVGKNVAFQVNAVSAGSGSSSTGGAVSAAPAYTGQGAGAYTVQADFAGDTNYVAASSTNTLTVTQENATLAYTGQTTMPAGGPSTISLSATVTEENPDLPAGTSAPGDITLAGTVQFVIKKVSDGTTVASLTAIVDSAGVVSITTIAPLPNIPYTVDVRLLANNYYTATAITRTIKATPTVVVDAKSGQYSDPVTLTATLTDGAGGVVGKSVAFQVNAVGAGSGTTVTGGAVSAAPAYTLQLGAGAYTIQADFAGDTNYVAATHSDSLTVTQENVTLAYTGQTVMPAGAASVISVSATVTQAADGSPGIFAPPAVTVQFVIKKVSDGTTVASLTAMVDSAGVASITTIAPLPNIPYTVDVRLLANNYYTATAITRTIKATPTLAAAAQSGQYSDPVTLTATLTDGAGGLVGKSVAFQVDAVGVGSRTTVTGGAVSVAPAYTMQLSAGAYTIKADFAGDTNYVAATHSADLTVTVEDATLAYTGQTVMPSGAASTVNLSATATQAADGSLGTFGPPAVNVQFVIKRVSDNAPVDTQTAVVNSSGVATATSIALPNTAYTVDVSVVANSYYTAPAISQRVKAATALAATAPATATTTAAPTITAKLTIQGTTTGIADKTVTFTATSGAATLTGTGTTDANGVATWTSPPLFPAGTWTIKASFDGATDADYDSSTSPLPDAAMTVA